MGIRDILLISTPEYQPAYQRLFHDGSQFGVSVSYAVQLEPKGIGEAFIIGEEFIGNDPVALILGDNIFHGEELTRKLPAISAENRGATLFGYGVADARHFGVVEIGADGRVLSIEEKPINPKSNLAVTGLYLYDNRVIEVAKTVQPSRRGELEITSVNQLYLKQGSLDVEILHSGVKWLDLGTKNAMLEASSYVKSVEESNSHKIACLEEIALNNGWVSKEDIESHLRSNCIDEYSLYIRGLLLKC